MKNSHNEIGSEFWSVPTSQKNGLFSYRNVSWHLSGRAALNAIIKEIKKERSAKTAALPSWCCDSMILPFLENGISVSFYSVCYEDGRLCQTVEQGEKADIVLVMDYFGYLSHNTVFTDGVVIRDLTHTVFSEEDPQGDFCFGSLRKWAGFYSGGFAFAKDGRSIPCYSDPRGEEIVQKRKEAMLEKAEYISGKTESKDFLHGFSQAEELLDSCFDGAADPRDVHLIGQLDIPCIKEKRRKNAEFLLEHFRDLAVFKEIGEKDCPLFVPILLDKKTRDGLKWHLIENRIYCPVHWPLTQHHGLTKKEAEIYEKEISLVCDQRYTIEDMKRIVFSVKSYFK
ncbi:MAG: hypothetical protein IKT50_05750 [Clostridia bacterium]|nr:hypothetical protein [Clostridia bacterium]